MAVGLLAAASCGGGHRAVDPTGSRPAAIGRPVAGGTSYAGSPSEAPSTLPARPAGTFGLSAPGADKGVAAAVSTGATLGRHVELINSYFSWRYDTAFPSSTVEAIEAAGATPELTWEPWDPNLGPGGDAFPLRDIAAGRFDALITTWARGAGAFGRPILIRFAHEMNTTGYPWAVGVNGNSAADYVAAFRHVHDVFLDLGVGNVSWVWSPNIDTPRSPSLAGAWPGTDYVSAIGLDGYNGGTDVPAMGGWKTPSDLFAETLADVRSISPATPVFVNETGCSPHGGDKPAWISDLFAYATLEHLARVVWFEHDQPGAADWRLTETAATTASARAALARF